MKPINKKLVTALVLMIGMLLGGSLGSSYALEIIIKTEPDAETVSHTGSLDSYVDDVLIPQSGRAEEGEYFSDFITNEEGYVTGRERTVLNGILSSEIRDFDGDGDSELLVLSAENITSEEEGDYAYNTVYLSIYEKEEENVVLKDRIEALTDVMGSCDKEDSGIFLVKNDDQIYICGSSYQNWGIWADGISFHSFILKYEDGSFVSLFDSGTWNGSDFWGSFDLEVYVDTLAEFSDSLGLSEEASEIRDTGYPFFSFLDDEEKMLLKITGDAPDFSRNYYTDYDPSYLGNVCFLLQTTSYNAGNSSEVSGQISDNDNMKSKYADIVLQYEEQYGQDDYDISEPSSLLIEMKGVYYLKLLDFNQDGTEELMIGYTVKDAGENQYGLDIWEYKDGQALRIYSDLSSSYNILYTFYEGQYYLITGDDYDEPGLQFLRLDGDTFLAEWTLIYQDDTFYINGSETQRNDYYDFYYGELCAERKSFSPLQTWRPTEGFLQVRPVRSLLGLSELDVSFYERD